MGTTIDDAFILELRIQFCQDALEIFEKIEGVLLILERNETTASIAELKRHLHCLKGNAQVAGFSNISKVSHDMETSISEGGVTEKISNFLTTTDSMAEAVKEFLNSKNPSDILDKTF